MMEDGFGTINPADLNNIPVSLPSTSASQFIDVPTTALKRSRSPASQEHISSQGFQDNESARPRKRGRPAKTKPPDSPASSGTINQRAANTPGQGDVKAVVDDVTQEFPAKQSPAHGAASKSVKSLPTQREHTTDEVSPDGDEYVVRDIDEEGEKKVTTTGHLTGGREYRCRTFFVPNRGNKLFMLATECARVLVYRDSYLLFNKNRSLFKIIASQVEKDDLIQQEILPWSYRSRQIAIVSAKSMFRQFGARMIVDGRRVRDDYWEARARKQGFTEDDLALEVKRPAVPQKPKETTGTDISSTGAVAMQALQRGKITYQNDDKGFRDFPRIRGIPIATGQMQQQNPTDDMGSRDYGTMQLPRQDITGTPYEDRTQSSSDAEVVNQAAQAMQFNQALKHERQAREHYFKEFYEKDRKVDITIPTSPVIDEATLAQIQNLQSPPKPAHSQPQLQQESAQVPLAPSPLSQQSQQQPLLQTQQQQKQPQSQPSQQSQNQHQQHQQQPHQQPQQLQQQTMQQPQTQPQAQLPHSGQQHMLSSQQSNMMMNPQQMMHHQQAMSPLANSQFMRQANQQNMQHSPAQNMAIGMNPQQAMHQRAASFNYPQAQQNPMFFAQNAVWAQQHPTNMPQQHPQQQQQPPQQQQQQQQQTPQQQPQQQQQQQHMAQYSGAPQQSPLSHQSPPAPPQMQQMRNPAAMAAFQGMGGMPQGFPQMQPGMFQQNAVPQQYMHQSGAMQQPAMMGWSPPPNMGQPQPGWQGY